LVYCCALGHRPKYNMVCIFSTFGIQNNFISRRMQLSKSGLKKMVDSVAIEQTIQYVISNNKMISRKCSLPYRILN